MHTYLRFILVAWLTLSCATAGATAILSARIDAFVAPLFKSDQPGATIIITKNGKTVFRKAFGMADLQTQRALDPETPMRLGSVTKQFTAAAILLLAEQGKLSLSDDFRKYLPDFPDKGHVITIEHLLTHTSGIPSYTDRPGYAAGMADELTVAQMVATFKDDPLHFAPAERFAYSNSGYFLLGAIIEKVSGMRYSEFLSKQIFEPLDMHRTAYEGEARQPPGLARGYSRPGETFVAASPLSMSQPFAAGALVSTVDDLARWNEAITSGKLLSPAMWRRAFTPYLLRDGRSAGYGYGWGMGTLKGHATAAHGGGINGFSAFVLQLPDDKVYVAVLANSESGSPLTGMVANRIAALAIDSPFPEMQAIRLTPGTFERYMGRYELRPGFVLELSMAGERYLATATGQAPVQIFPLSESIFFATAVDAKLRIERDANGKTVGLVLLQGGRELPGRRLP